MLSEDNVIIKNKHDVIFFAELWSLDRVFNNQNIYIHFSNSMKYLENGSSFSAGLFHKHSQQTHFLYVVELHKQKYMFKNNIGRAYQAICSLRATGRA